MSLAMGQATRRMTAKMDPRSISIAKAPNKRARLARYSACCERSLNCVPLGSAFRTDYYLSRKLASTCVRSSASYLQIYRVFRASRTPHWQTSMATRRSPHPAGLLHSNCIPECTISHASGPRSSPSLKRYGEHTSTAQKTRLKMMSKRPLKSPSGPK